MNRLQRVAGSLAFAAALAAPLLLAGCEARVRYYDSYHNDYHRWNGGEVRAYHVWVGERHYEYRDYNRLNAEEQRDYWNWRHDHPGRY